MVQEGFCSWCYVVFVKVAGLLKITDGAGCEGE